MAPVDKPVYLKGSELNVVDMLTKCGPQRIGTHKQASSSHFRIRRR